jgi:RNA polymerase sigma-70 factor (ECF subfamily)
VIVLERGFTSEIDQDRDFDAAVREHAAALYRVALSILRDPVAAEDAVQVAFESAWKAWGSLRDPGARGAWLRRICVRESLRARGRTSPLELTADVVDARTGSRPDLALENALRRLPARQRAVLALHYGHGYALDECATLLGCRPGTVRSHLGRALAELRKELRDD